MAKFSVNIPTGLQAQLAKLANIDEVAPEMLTEAAPIVAEAVRVRTPKKSGALKRSITVKKAQKTKTGAWLIEIHFSGYDENGTPNNLKAGVLEYGNRKDGKRKHQFVYPAVKDSEKKAQDKMQEVFEKEMNK